MMKFFIVKDDVRQGPYEVEELARQGLSPDTLVWTKGMPDWTEASAVPELAGAVEASVPDLPASAAPHPAVGIDAPPAACSAGQQPASQAPPLPHSVSTDGPARHHDFEPRPFEPKKKSGRGWIVLLVAIAVLGLLVVSKPNRQRHVDEISAACRQYVDETVDSSLLGQIPVAGEGAKWLSGKVVNGFLETRLEMDDYFFFNVGKLQFQGKRRTVSLGVLGYVFTFGKEDVAQVVQRYVGVPDDKAFIDKAQEKMEDAETGADKIVGKIDFDTTQVGDEFDSLTRKVKSAVTHKARKVAAHAIEGIANEISRQLGEDPDDSQKRDQDGE